MKKTVALVDCRISEKCKSALCENGFSVFELPPMRNLPSPIASHTDILTFYIDGVLFLSEMYASEQPKIYEELLRLLPPGTVRLTREYQRPDYPSDAIFNALIMGRTLFCKRDSFSPEILRYAEEIGYKIVSTKQGYPACTTLKISENAAITADKGMAKILCAHGISVTLIENGDISLPPYEYGFIGGAAGSFSDKLYFLGDLEAHPSAKIITEAIERTGKKYISLSDDMLSDLGGITFI